MKKYFVWLSLMSMGFVANAQFTLESLYDQYLIEKFRNMGDFSNIDGYPYLEREFQEARVVFKSGSSQVYMLRYNNFLDEMELKQNDKITHVANRSDIDKIEIKNQVYRVYPVTKENQKSLEYFIELSTGKLSLLKKAPIVYMPARKPEGGYQDYLPPRFVILDPIYYIKTEKDGIQELPVGKAKLLGHLDKLGYDASRIFKEKKLKNNEEGYKALIEEINANG